MRIVFVTWLAAAALGCSSAPAQWPAGLDPSRDGAARGLIRVGLHVDVEHAEFELPSAATLRGPAGSLGSPRTRGRFIARRAGAGVELRAPNGTLLASAAWIVVDAGRSGFRTKDNEYDGQLMLRPARAGITAVNVLPLERYLRGVVPWEIGRPGEEALEAVKAQAIAARTYTVAHLGHWNALGFDVYDSVSDQVYRGRTGTDAVADRAIEETKGLVASYGGKLIRAYYSSTCGGHTSTLSDVWTREPAPYLRGRRDRDGARAFCAESPHFRWSEGWSARELGEQIRTHLPVELARAMTPDEIGILRDLRVTERDPSGRVKRLVIVTDRAEFEVRGDRIRWVLRPVHTRFSILRSTMFDVETLRRENGALAAVRLRGGGFGHGVGLCQTGAIGMARRGYGAEEIVAHYYAGAVVRPADL